MQFVSKNYEKMNHLFQIHKNLVRFTQITLFLKHYACFRYHSGMYNRGKGGYLCRSQLAVGLNIGPDVPGKKAPLHPRK